MSPHTKAALRERVKELTCLYNIARIAERPELSLDEVLKGISDLLPPAWQYLEIASAEIVIDGRPVRSANYAASPIRQRADIFIENVRRGYVEVNYQAGADETGEDPFLKEEQNLIHAVAREVGLIVHRKETEEERARLQEQLMHAERLATIGQLAAGVAHELNEPLSNILGFAQLAAKCPGLPDQAARDIEKIERGVLRAREIIRQLLLFSRQTAHRETRLDLNRLIEDSMQFFEARCAADGIELVSKRAPDLPPVTGDATLLHQVLVNLMVNAIQAMSGGGTLTLSTSTSDEHVVLAVEDTGPGMDADTLKQIFLPFFTTKDVGQGTGLGLPVVHGIVTSHGGSINVESAVGRGSRFVVTLPVARDEEDEADDG